MGGTVTLRPVSVPYEMIMAHDKALANWIDSLPQELSTNPDSYMPSTSPDTVAKKTRSTKQHHPNKLLGSGSGNLYPIRAVLPPTHNNHILIPYDPIYIHLTGNTIFKGPTSMRGPISCRVVWEVVVVPLCVSDASGGRVDVGSLVVPG
ncbi:hypothetical protein EDB19DRAFT_2021066 [Suillus lakei]|nr:hypothetical protein EDB19DRAFT_2021066 [Suillus lakei]